MPSDETSKSGVFLVTHFGTVLCHHDGVLSHKPIPQALREGVALAVQGTALALELPDIRGPGVEMHRRGTIMARVTPTVRPGVIALQCGDRYLCVFPDGEPALSVSKAGPWECLFMLTGEQLAVLNALLEDRWIGRDGMACPFRLEHDMRLMHGETEFSLFDTFETPFGAPIVGPERAVSDRAGTLSGQTEQVNRIVMWRERWQPHSFVRFRPLVYFAAFGEDALRTLLIALSSLEEIGGYTGDVLVITDLALEDLVRWCPVGERITLHVWNVFPAERFDMFNARYDIHAWPDVRRFGPFLYLDTDVVIDLPIEPLLRGLVGMDRIAFQEEIGAGFATHGSVGSEVINADTRIDAGRKDGYGVNSGLIAFWDIDRAAFIFRMITGAIYRHAHAERSRDTLTHYDQALANYVLLLEDACDTLTLTPRVAVYFVGRHRLNTASNHDSDHERALDDRRGFVHFWGADDKALRMQEYLDYLRAAHS